MTKAHNQSVDRPITLNPLFQKLAHTNLVFIMVLYLMLSGFFIYGDLAYFNWKTLLGLFLTGLLTWTLVEYCVHRFIFHGRTKIRALQLFRYFMHGYHHEKPNDSKRLVLPLILTLPIVLANYAWVKLLFGSGTTLIAGFTVGYVIYDFVHYHVHCHQPKTRLGKFLKYYHFYHHFKNHQRCFGVTSPTWDHPFKTYTKVRVRHGE